MSSLSEWELLEITDDIEPGDLVDVDDCGATIKMVFVKCDRNIVTLKPRGGQRRYFRGSSLEEIDGEAYITGKSEDDE